MDFAFICNEKIYEVCYVNTWVHNYCNEYYDEKVLTYTFKVEKSGPL